MVLVEEGYGKNAGEWTSKAERVATKNTGRQKKTYRKK